MPRLGNEWLVSEAERTPVSRVATRTIRARLQRVWDEARVAAGNGQSADAVHRLRVATRRTLAAIEAFRDLLPPRRTAWFEKRLRRLRRAAGDARDLDVLTVRLRSGPPRPVAAQRARRRLVAMLSQQRDVSRQPIRELYEELLAADWQARMEELLERISSPGREPRFGRYARRRFKPVVVEFFSLADRKLRSATEIHRLRIEGKKLRYALEIFAAVFPPRVRARCQDALEQLQETLGEFTDHAAAADRFRRWARDDGMTSDRHTLSALRVQEEELANDARKVFVKWWNPTRRRSLRRAFARTLRRDSA